MSRDPIVFVVDDDAAARQSLAMLLGSMGIEVATFDSGEALLAAAPFDETRHSCLLLDVRMPGMSGMAVLEQLHRQGIRIPTVVISGYGDIPMAVRAMKLGAVDFIAKPIDQQAILDLVQGLLRQPPTPATALPNAETLERWHLLTPREREVFQAVAAGRSNKTIAKELGLSVRTVEIHRARLMRKLGAHGLADLVLLGVQLRSHWRDGPD